MKKIAFFLFLGLLVSCIPQEKPSVVGDTFTDSRDGNVYKIVTIDNKVWMAENLAYLPSVVGPKTGSKTTPYYYVYDYNGTSVSAAKATNNYKTYGVLYNWLAASTACPAGWRMPSYTEWRELVEEHEGGKLKEEGTRHWKDPNSGATNETGFTALPGGYRDSDGTFNRIGEQGSWWSISMYSADDLAWYRFLRNGSPSYYKSYSYGNAYGRSVRCIKD